MYIFHHFFTQLGRPGATPKKHIYTKWIISLHGNITCLEIFEPECSVSIHVALEDVAVEHYFGFAPKAVAGA